MGILRKRSARKNEICTFDFLREHSLEEVANWACDIVNSGIVITDVIALWDVERSSDEGNNSIDFSCPVEEKSILSAMKEREVDRLVFSGRLGRAPITVNFNLKEYEVNVAMHKDHLLDEYKVEKALKLSRQRYERYDC